MSEFEWTEQDSINLTAKLVAHDGHRMALRGAEREAALRMMAALGLDRHEMARRLCIGPEAAWRAASYYGITIQPVVEPQHWTVAVADRSKSLDAVRARKKRREARDQGRVAA